MLLPSLHSDPTHASLCKSLMLLLNDDDDDDDDDGCGKNRLNSLIM